MSMLYAKEFSNHDAEIIEIYVREFITKNFPSIDNTTQFMANGFIILLLLAGNTGHTSSWMMSWNVENPTIIDTGFDDLSLSDPLFEHLIIDHLNMILMTIKQLCKCQKCQLQQIMVV